MTKVYKVDAGILVEWSQGEETLFSLIENVSWDQWFNSEDAEKPFAEWSNQGMQVLDAEVATMQNGFIYAPIQSQEVWAAGVTYFRSRVARMEESKDAGGGDFYDRVYDADRPEIFFKATAHRVSGPGEPLRIRKDSSWNVPEPELTLAVNFRNKLIGYTVGNDMSSRSIEGENPLYLPQAKTYDQCAGLGPGLLLTAEPLPAETKINIGIHRGDQGLVFQGSTDLAQMKRRPDELIGWLTREASFPDGAYLMTGTGVIPEGDFTLLAGDEVEIEIEGIGILKNPIIQ